MKNIIKLSCEHKNFINDKKTYVLPILFTENAVVEVVICNGHVMVESEYHPIRYGKYCGNRVFLGQTYGMIDLTPKFIWNGKEWLLNTFGTFVFAEIEINAPMRNDE